MGQVHFTRLAMLLGGPLTASDARLPRLEPGQKRLAHLGDDGEVRVDHVGDFISTAWPISSDAPRSEKP